MAVHVVMDPDWRIHLEAPEKELLGRLARDVAEDARAICPVDTGALRATIRAEDNRVLAGGGEVDYAVYVELGTRHMAAEPYLRPATFRRRDS